ncbi:MAG: hypothetical protein K9J37_02330 [Saprospiraceae bacterium]|nr:hypothetical protein [Saprospiraceae bacterium]MCF8248717.1 hypothetical protein [Saprospiraceae bacterium]MCF8278793.1 hypothetical protein [Bacteroidales bacterium]MCF8310593.1 hypothetical protein [Saprospiraceae bacterium]MCF8439152.1 hypothetical protein [Saprospiraceae bacterium]
MQNWKNGFSLLLFTVVAWGVMQSFATAKIERSKVIKKDFDAKSEVSASHQYGPLTVKKSTDGRIHLEAEMLLTGSDEASIEEVLARFDVAVKESDKDLQLETDLGIESCNSINNKKTIKYKDGRKVKGINEMKVKMTLWVPNPAKLKLDNKYDRIELTDDYTGELRVMLYSGDFVAANLGGSLDLDLKYGKAKMGNVEKVKLNIYDSKVNMGNLSQARVNGKYSEFVLGNVGGDMDLETYDDNWQVGNVGGRLKLEDKYSAFKFGNIGGASMVFFDAVFIAEEVGDVEIRDTKYSEVKLTKVGNLKLGNVFDDDYRIKVAGSIEAKDSKYTEYRVGKLGKQFTISQSFDDTVELESVAADFNQIGIVGKYTELALSIAEGAQFQLDVDMKYGKISYPESRLEISKHQELNSQTTIKGTVGTAQTGGQMNSLKMTGFDNTLTWKD